MTDFTKAKMHFTLALLGTLFAIHPFVDRIENWGFDYGYKEYSVELKVYHVYALISALLAFTVYCYALTMMGEHHRTWSEKLGNYSYGTAAMVLPLYGGLYAASWLANQMEHTEVAWAVRLAPFVPLSLGAIWFIISQIVAFRLKDRLGDQDRVAKIQHLAEHEITALNRAPEMFSTNHFDLSVIESWKALESRLRRALLLHGHKHAGDDAKTVIETAIRKGIINEKTYEQIQETRKHWEVAISTEPLQRDCAERVLQMTRDILATIPVVDPVKK